jgi:hypothetical protein
MKTRTWAEGIREESAEEGAWNKLYKERNYGLNSTPDIIQIIKAKRRV